MEDMERNNWVYIHQYIHREATSYLEMRGEEGERI